MEILRAKTLDLRPTRPLSEAREANSRLNEREALEGADELESRPRRLVLELTSACNLDCLMCGRSATNFKPTVFDFQWLELFEPAVEEIEEATLMGWGEPTIHPRFKDFLVWADRRGLRKYFCTNGQRLKQLQDDIFAANTDLLAVSLDGASRRTNEAIRRGSDFNLVVNSLERLTSLKARRKLDYPYINLVFTAMGRNLAELPDLVRLASEIGLEEVKVVYFTAFDQRLAPETLRGRSQWVAEVFGLAEVMAEKCSVALKLPYLEGRDPAGEALHRPCYTAWRDLFLGSDGRFRPCMSTSRQFFVLEPGRTLDSIWNSEEYRRHRRTVNGPDQDDPCRRCYQSSVANWNQPHAFLQLDEDFAPDWGA